jgi:saccharopine dehydrogenase (NAD+, L-lysine-forming)
MPSYKIGLLRERKSPPDRRVPFTPAQVVEIRQRFPEVTVVCEQSAIRCFSDSEYESTGTGIQASLSDCDILMGIKEVTPEDIIPGKTYIFFSHTIKKQPHNRKLLQTIVSRKATLIDYEAMKDYLGNRLVAFGRYAGMVGAYNGLLTYGKRMKLFTMKRAFDCYDVNALKIELRNLKLPAIKIALTGAGRVGKGAMESLDTAGIRKVTPSDFLHGKFEQPVYTQLGSGDYHFRKEGGAFSREEFHQHPERYESSFREFTRVTDLLLAGAYWNPKAPVLFTREEMMAADFRITVVADITCDIDGSIPSTKKASSIVDPIYDYDPMSDTVQPPLSSERFVTVMAIDNLPCELPRSASEEFGHDLIDRILSPLLTEDTEHIIERATIISRGALTRHFEYLRDYAFGS